MHGRICSVCVCVGGFAHTGEYAVSIFNTEGWKHCEVIGSREMKLWGKIMIEGGPAERKQLNSDRWCLRKRDGGIQRCID